ncbi:MAG: NAD(P)H-dependent oxidoreductase subunit E [Anaerolineae bacterium]|nr:NAD(P)H-dependent oxidoreductase subunit E [Anaerolineae bacterium]
MKSQPRYDVSEIGELLWNGEDGDRSLMAVLEEIQARYRYLPEDALILVSERLGVPLSQTYSVATFYNAFSLEPKGRHVVNVCMGTACNVRGSRKVLERIRDKLGIQPGQTTEDGEFTLETVNCLGACALGPIVVVDGTYSGQMNGSKADALIREVMSESEGS